MKEQAVVQDFGKSSFSCIGLESQLETDEEGARTHGPSRSG